MAGLERLLATQSDVALLSGGALLMAALAIAVAFAARAALFRVDGAVLETHGKLADAVHGSLLAFAVFVLALVLTDVRSNFGKADDAALREGSTLARLDRDLAAAAGPDAEAARAALRAYAQAVTRDEWKTLAEPAPRLSEEAGRRLAALAATVRPVAQASPDGPALRALLDKAEELRQGRLESATKSVPPLFWQAMAALILGAMVMNGRHTLEPFGLGLIALHMGAIGMVVALILAMDSPFRGETSVSPATIERVDLRLNE